MNITITAQDSTNPFPALSFIETVIIFGGTGFIGTHLTAFLLENFTKHQIIVADLRPFDSTRFLPPIVAKALENGRVRYIPVDVRQPMTNAGLPNHVDLIVNLAAICREPGHEHQEYFETNLKGAENVCAWAEQIDCRNILFTSSIAVYGIMTGDTDETALPLPRTPYGSSKLAAELIHRRWQERGIARRLLIVRPGVVYGSGENANVTRLIRAVLKRQFVYTGNRATRKAGGYVKELCRVLIWSFERQYKNQEGFLLANFGTVPIPTVSEYVQTLIRVSGRSGQWIPTFPLSLIRALSIPIAALSRISGRKTGIDPIRVEKVARSTPIIPAWLLSSGYQWKYSLEEALSDWYDECPSDWIKK